MEEGRPAERIGDYEFLDRLAVGGMGQLWRVRHVKLDAVYVAKVLRPELREDPEFVKRFLNEARLVANLRHPNVVQVFDFDEEHMLYLMEYVEGMDLERLVRRRRNFELADKRTIVEVVADTIGFAHREHDLIHRDIKPSNVLIAITDPDATIQASQVKLTDFGIARVLSIDQRVTMSSGVVMGTVHYMAPEQFEGHADKPSDVYAIGVLYYQLLTGALPFEGPTAFVVRDKHISEIPPAPHELDPGIPLEDSLIVMRCLEKDPADRYQDGAELHEALASVSPTTRTMTIPHRRRRRAAAAAPPPAGVTGAARRAGKKARERKPRRWLRHLVRAAIALAAVIVLAFLATLVLKPHYEIRWDTLRCDPQDTPRGVKVWVCPKIGLRLFWWPVGTITDKAPQPWANWTTWFDSVHVRLSDGFYRQFVITCSPAEGSDRVDFQGVTFEELARKRNATVREDPAGIPDYVNAILAPANVASAQSLPDVLAGLERVGRLLAKAKGAAPRKTNLEAYRAAASAMAKGTSALANGDCPAAEKQLAEAEEQIADIAKVYKKQLPDDFLFRATLRAALGEVKSRAAKAQRVLEVLEPLADSPASIAYTLKRYADAREALAAYLAFAPGPAALPTNAPAEPAAIEKTLREAKDNPAPTQSLLLYLQKLDAAVAYSPPAPQREAWRARLLQATDEAASAARLEPAPWLARALSREELALLPRLASLWAEAHRRRVAAAARLCREFAAEAIKSAATASQPDRAFKSAETALEAVRAAANVADPEKQQATTLLSTCCVRHALTLFTVSPTHSPEALANILVLMDRGLTELPGCDPKAKEEALALRETLRALGPARQALTACIRENFSTSDRRDGGPQTLFTALAAYEQLAAQVASRGPYPSSRAALEPFEHLDAESCRGFSLPGAAAWWLVGKALEECENGRYAAAAPLLRGLLITPGQQKPSPLKRLLPDELTKAAAALAAAAASFDETAMPAGAPPGRWRKLWEKRLAARSALPAQVAAPASADRQKELAAVAGLMGRLVSHFRQVAAAEEELRSVETQVTELVVREGGKVKPNPAKATPAAIARALAAVTGLASDKRFASADHPDRVAALRRDLNLIRAGTEGLSKQLDELLARPDPRAALDLLEAAGAALGRDTELALTRKALALWVKSATTAADAADFDRAAAAFKAIGGNAQLKRHAQDPEVTKALAEAATMASYCEGREALAGGPGSFAEALASFKRAEGCRDAAALVRQLEAFSQASALGEKAPLAALERFAALLKTKGLNPQVARAAGSAAKAVRASFLVAASACVSAFNKRLTTGEWERYLDRTSVSDQEVARIKAFLDSVQNLQVEEPTVQPDGQFSPEGLRATLKRTRTLKFTLALPNAQVPMAVVQTITWTLNYARPKGEEVGRWLITGWEEAN